MTPESPRCARCGHLDYEHSGVGCFVEIREGTDVFCECPAFVPPVEPTAEETRCTERLCSWCGRGISQANTSGFCSADCRNVARDHSHWPAAPVEQGTTAPTIEAGGILEGYEMVCGCGFTEAERARLSAQSRAIEAAEKFERNARHSPRCLDEPNELCTCGLNEFRAALRAALTEIPE